MENSLSVTAIARQSYVLVDTWKDFAFESKFDSVFNVMRGVISFKIIKITKYRGFGDRSFAINIDISIYQYTCKSYAI